MEINVQLNQVIKETLTQLWEWMHFQPKPSIYSKTLIFMPARSQNYNKFHELRWYKTTSKCPGNTLELLKHSLLL
ncbi:hypothetical protein EUGRSUZ_A01808 [Eucalyptus grandis]|uniref:Uncharacterized protein n=2 Tax=Eucalyptus grandis TaxID=71139 RepID=A0ACC3M4H5_EUCGR|nr:hypothetical protein EUGRSUZ_A01808 [Eucalyptus grandis]